MQRLQEKLSFGQTFHDLAQIHDGHVVAYVSHHGQVMGYEKVSEPSQSLELFKQVQYLGLH